MNLSSTRSRVTVIGIMLLAVCLTVGLTGCAADEPTTTTPPATDQPATPDDGGASATGTVPADTPLAAGATHSIGEVLDTPSEGQQVVLGGEIIAMISAEDFTLSDETGEVFVDGDNDFGALAVGDQLLVTGTVDVEDSPARIEIQATAIEKR